MMEIWLMILNHDNNDNNNNNINNDERYNNHIVMDHCCAR